MKVRVRWIAAAALMIAVPVWAGGGSAGKGGQVAEGEREPARIRAEVGQAAPMFTLKDLAGKEYKLADWKGKIVVLEWTNHMCPFVARHHAEQKTTQNTLAKFKGKDVVWFAINSSSFCEEKVTELRDWVKRHGITYPMLLDASGKVGHLYGAKTTPQMFVIDRKGVLVYSGAIDDDRYGEKKNKRNYVEEAVTSLVNGSTVAVSSTKSYGCSVKYKK